MKHSTNVWATLILSNSTETCNEDSDIVPGFIQGVDEAFSDELKQDFNASNTVYGLP